MKPGLIDWDSPEVQKSLREHIEETDRKEKYIQSWLVRNYFPEHRAHRIRDEWWEFFDAMLARKVVKCYCDHSYIVSREMIEEACEAYTRYTKKKGKRKP